MDKLASVIVVTHNSRKRLKHCLQRVDWGTFSPYELLVVDNASQDGSVSWLRKYQPVNPYCRRVEKLFNKNNRGWSYAVNQGVKVAGGRYIALLSVDVTVTEHWLARLAEHLRTAPEAGLVAPIGYGLWLDQDYEKWYGTPPYLKDDRISLDEFAGSLYETWQGSITEVKFVINSCVLTKSEVFDRIGLYDERLFLYTANFDFSFRAGLAGFRMYVAEDVFVHCFRRNGRLWLEKNSRIQRIKDYAYFYAKWKELSPQRPAKWHKIFAGRDPLWYKGLRVGRRNKHDKHGDRFSV